MRTANDVRGEAGMQLALAEINFSKKGSKKRTEAFQQVSEACKLYSQVSDNKMLACAQLLLVNLHHRLGDPNQTLQAATLALTLHRSIGDKKGVGKSLHAVALARVAAGAHENGLQAAKEALAIFRDLGLKKMEAFELSVIARWQLDRGRPQEGLTSALNALNIFQEIGYGKGWEAATFALVIDMHLANGNYSEALATGTTGLDRMQSAEDVRGEIVLLDMLSRVHLACKDGEAACSAVEDAIAACQDIDEQEWLAGIRMNAARVYQKTDHYEEAAAEAREALTLYIEIGNTKSAACVLHFLTDMQVASGQGVEALETVGEVQWQFSQAADPSAEASALVAASSVHVVLEEFEEAEALAARAQQIANEVGDKRVEALACHALSEVFIQNNEYEDAVNVLKTRLDLCGQVRDKQQQVETLSALFRLHLMKGDARQATKSAQEAQLLCRTNRDKWGEARALLMVAQANVSLVQDTPPEHVRFMLMVKQSKDKAARAAQEGLEIAQQRGYKSLEGAGHYWVAKMFFLDGKHDEALRSAEQALTIFKTINEAPSIAQTQVFLGQVYHKIGKIDSAVEMIKQGISFFKKNGDQDGLESAKQLLGKIQGAKEVAPVAAAVSTVASAETTKVDKPDVVLQKPDMDMIEVKIKNAVGNAIGGADSDEIEVDVPLLEMGLDSLSSLELRNTLQKDFGLKLNAQLVFDYPTVQGLSEHIYGALERNIEKMQALQGA